MNECTYGNLEAVEIAIKALEQEPCEDCVSRAEVNKLYDKYGPRLATHVLEFGDKLKALPSVTPTRVETVTDFADKCRECGARYGGYKDFCEFVAEMVLEDDFEECAGANVEILCRKLSKLGIVKADKDEWVLAESEK